MKDFYSSNSFLFNFNPKNEKVNDYNLIFHN